MLLDFVIEFGLLMKCNVPHVALSMWLSRKDTYLYCTYESLSYALCNVRYIALSKRKNSFFTSGKVR